MTEEKWFVTAKRADFQGIADRFGISPVTARLIRNRDIVGDAAIDGLVKVAAGLTALSVASQMSGVDGAASILTMSSAMLVLAGAVAIYARLGNAAWGAMFKCGVALAGMGVAVLALSKCQNVGSRSR